MRNPTDAMQIEDLVAERLRDRRERPRHEQHTAPGQLTCQRAERRHAREQVTEPERAQNDEVRRHGQDGSTEGVMTSSRSSTPAGRVSAKSTASAISAGSTSWASAAGL